MLEIHSFLSLQELECNVLDLQQDGPHSELGRGAFGAVYRMKHKPTGTIMAVKVILRDTCINVDICTVHVPTCTKGVG